jgi:glycosyltransferase involved in cell wall biosynthesis
VKVLQVYNQHRGGGGSDNARDETIRLTTESGIETRVFCRDSRDITAGVGGNLRAFAAGIYSGEAVAALSRELENFKPDVVHAHELYPLISHWVLPACRKANVPVVYTCYDFRLTCPIATHYNGHGICHKCAERGEHWAVINNCRANLAESAAYGLRNFITRRFRLVTDNVSHFTVLGEFSRDWLVNEVGIAGNRITVISCVIELPASAVDDPASGQYVGFAGRFADEKGVEVLLEAARRANLPVKLAGDATDHPAIRQGDRVECVLTRSREELAAFYRGARMLVVPSIWYETFGIVAGEAMSHGIPVVASRLGALQQTVTDNVTGLLFETGSVEDLAAKMTRLWTDDGLCRILGKAAREKVRTEFSPEVHVNGFLHAYERAIRDRQDAL